MRMSREATARSREKIIAEAAKMLRARGVEGASVADVMQAAGMTHGGFYKHFESKDALLAEAISAAFAEAARRFDARAASDGVDKAAASYVRNYLSRAHVDHPEQGCPVASIGFDAARRPEAMSAAFVDGVQGLVERLSAAKGSREQAIEAVLMMAGAVVAARSVGEGPLREEILNVARRALT